MGLMLFAALSELAAKIRPHSLDEVTLSVARVGRMFLFFDVSKAQRELGYVLRPIDETLRDTLRDFVDRGLTAPRTPALAALASKRLATG
jgi:dihydroflavonol-4-reductase